jgi:intracellular septation protein
MNMKTIVKIMTDFVPLIAFFITYKIFGMITATAVLLVASLIGLAAHYAYHKTLPVVLIISTLIIVVLGSITVISGNTSFVKIKPTIVSLAFAAILFHGVYYKKGYTKHIFNSAINLTEQNWVILSKRFALLFLCIAIINEIIWRTMPENIWVNFKVFGILAMTIVFFISQLAFINKNNLK